MEAGPFILSIKTSVGSFAPVYQFLYSDFPRLDRRAISDFNISLKAPFKRRWIRPQVVFLENGRKLFEPFPYTMSLPLFEWGWNWCIGSQSHQFLILHSAVLEKNGKAVLLPALPGSGKTTLCAALMLSGWRLFSDEFGLVRGDGLLVPLPRPLPLKNQSIEIIRAFSRQARIGPLYPKTRKGAVAHLAPTQPSVDKMKEPAKPELIVFPRFQKGAPATLKPVAPTYAFLKLATNAFNYEILGAEGFRRVAKLIRQCQFYNFTYGKLEEALPVFESLFAP